MNRKTHRCMMRRTEVAQAPNWLTGEPYDDDQRGISYACEARGNLGLLALSASEPVSAFRGRARSVRTRSRSSVLRHRQARASANPNRFCGGNPRERSARRCRHRERYRLTLPSKSIGRSVAWQESWRRPSTSKCGCRSKIGTGAFRVSALALSGESCRIRAMGQSLDKGYAVGGTDTGHQSEWDDGTWAMSDGKLNKQRGRRLGASRHSRDDGEVAGDRRRVIRTACAVQLLHRLLQGRLSSDDRSSALSGRLRRHPRGSARKLHHASASRADLVWAGDACRSGDGSRASRSTSCRCFAKLCSIPAMRWTVSRTDSSRIPQSVRSIRNSLRAPAAKIQRHA